MLGFSSILSLPSQIDIQRQRRMLSEIAFQPAILDLRRLYDHSRLIYFVAEIQALYGFRISEVLSISLEQISSDCKVEVQRLKREDPVVISLTFQERFIHNLQKSDLFLFSMLTRHSVYYTYKELGIGFKSKFSTKTSVTHSFRHRIVRKWLDEGYTYEEISVLLGHEDVRNTELYGIES